MSGSVPTEQRPSACVCTLQRTSWGLATPLPLWQWQDMEKDGVRLLTDPSWRARNAGYGLGRKGRGAR